MNPKLFRYWMARFRPIATSRVWLPLVGASMVGGFVWIAHSNPESLSFIGGSDGTGDLEASSIGADIDSVSVLMQEMGDRPMENANPDATKTLATLLKPGAGKDSAKLPDGGGVINSLAQLVRFSPDATLPLAVMSGSSVLNSGLNSDSNPVAAQNPLFTRNEPQNQIQSSRANPLAQAIDRLTGQGYSNQAGYSTGFEPGENRGTAPIEGTGLVGNSRAWSGIPSEGTSGLTTPAPPIVNSSSSGRSDPGTSYSPNNPYTNNPYINLTGAPSGYALPDPGIALPIAPTGIPIVPNAGFNSGNVNSGVVTPFPSPGTSAPEASSFPSEPTFSAPRSIPGRSIGGGNINTFSNP